MQLWPHQESTIFHEAIIHDFHVLLCSFLRTYNLTFTNFKRIYAELSFTEIYKLCPNRIHQEMYFQHLIQHVLSLLHHPSNDIEIFSSYPIQLSEALWNIGVFFLLYCLFGTRLECHNKLRIRVSPEEWFEVILAYQRFKSLGNIGIQAMKVFHKLQTDSAFHFSCYSGGPSLYRVMKIIEDIRLKQFDNRHHPNYLQNIAEGNEFIKSQIEDIRALVLLGLNGHSCFIVTQNLTPLDLALLGESNQNPVTMDQEMREFFGVSTSTPEISQEQLLEPDTDEVETHTLTESLNRSQTIQQSALSLLEQLEQETGEILGTPRRTNTVKAAKSGNRKKNSKTDQIASDPVTVLEQLENDSLEVLGSTVESSVKKKRRAESSNRRSKTPKTAVLSKDLTRDLSTEQTLAQQQSGDSQASVKTKKGKARKENHNILSLLEQLEHDTTEVLGFDVEKGD